MTRDRCRRQRAAARSPPTSQYYLTLQPRQLPSRYLYDALGSALFEAICQLPWYRDHARRAAPARRARAPRSSRSGRPLSTLVELGPGNGEKLATLLEAGAARRSPRRAPGRRLRRARSTLARADARARSTVSRGRRTRRPTKRACVELRATRRAPAARRWRCSSDRTSATSIRPAPTAFLRGIRARARAGRRAADRRRSREAGARAAARLRRSARRHGGVQPQPAGAHQPRARRRLRRSSRFAHRAVWNAAESRVEMHLVSRRASGSRSRPPTRLHRSKRARRSGPRARTSSSATTSSAGWTRRLRDRQPVGG